jgi:hypothetical protein
MNQTARTGGDAVTAGTARTGAKGHFLQPEWHGNDAIRERFEAVRPLLSGGSIFDIGCASRYVPVAYDPDNPGGSRDAGHATSH